MALYLPRYLLQWRERERDDVPKVYRIQNLKKERTVSTSSQRGPPIVFLCGVWLWRGQACSADSPENAKETSPTPAPPAEDTSPAVVWLQSSVRQSISLHRPAFIPLLSPVLFSPPSGWNVSTHFSLYALCLTDVGERSLWWCCAGEMSRNVRELLMSCNSESTCVGMTFKNLSSCKISQNVCTSLFWKLFIQII